MLCRFQRQSIFLMIYDSVAGNSRHPSDVTTKCENDMTDVPDWGSEPPENVDDDDWDRSPKADADDAGMDRSPKADDNDVCMDRSHENEQCQDCSRDTRPPLQNPTLCNDVSSNKRIDNRPPLQNPSTHMSWLWKPNRKSAQGHACRDCHFVTSPRHWGNECPIDKNYCTPAPSSWEACSCRAVIPL